MGHQHSSHTGGTPPHHHQHNASAAASSTASSSQQHPPSHHQHHFSHPLPPTRTRGPSNFEERFGGSEESKQQQQQQTMHPPIVRSSSLSQSSSSRCSACADEEAESESPTHHPHTSSNAISPTDLDNMSDTTHEELKTAATDAADATAARNRSPLSVVLEFASSVPPALLHTSSITRFGQLHSDAASSLSIDTPLCARHARAAGMSAGSLAEVSDAIHHGLKDTATSSSSSSSIATPAGVPQTPQTPSLLTQDAQEQKMILLKSLFQAIDKSSNGYLEREELLTWINNEPWLMHQDNLQRESQRMLDLVTHDEDSRCSRNEFIAAFDCFSTADLITLIVNLLRAGMVSKIPRLCYVYNSHDPYTNGLPSSASFNHLDPSPEPGAHGTLSVSDTPAHTLMYGQSRGEAERHFFLLDMLFQSFDRDLDGHLDVKDLSRWLRADNFVHAPENVDLFEAVDSCWRELVAKNAAAGFDQPPELPLNAKESASSSQPIGPAKIDKHFFFLIFSQVPKKMIRKLLVHLLSRNTNNVLEDAAVARSEAKQRQAASSESMSGTSTPNLSSTRSPPTSDTTSLPAFPHALMRKHSVVTGGARRISVADGLRVTLVGQAMIQHDIRLSKIGKETLKEMTPLLRADVIFTELETSLVRPGRQPEKTRNTVFFHAASPDVLDCLVQMGFNMYSTANNHAGDLGEEGIRTLMEEFAARNLCMSGIGENLYRASRPSFLNTPNGRIAQVSFASKVPEASIARENAPGVNSLSMIDVDTHTLNPIELQRVLSAIEDARDGYIDLYTNESVPKADMIIAYQHNHYWEKQAAVNQEGAFGAWKRELAHRTIDAGAHCYFAHGDPRLQGIEVYKGAPIFYCLGNFIFQTKTALSFYGAEVWQSVIVHLHCHDITEATSYSVKLLPVVLNESGETEANHLQTRGLPKLASRQVGHQILLKLQQLSTEFGTTIAIEDSIEGDETSPVIGWVLNAVLPKFSVNAESIDLSTQMPSIEKQLSGLHVFAKPPTPSSSAAASSSSSSSAGFHNQRHPEPATPILVPLTHFDLPIDSNELSPQASIYPELENEIASLKAAEETANAATTTTAAVVAS